MEDGPESNSKPASSTPGLSAQQSQLYTELRKLSRARTRLLVCLLTLPVYAVALWVLLNNQQNIEAFMYIYMGMWAGFAIDMARRRCPSCRQQYYVKSVLLNLITRRCVHCGLESKISGSDDEASKQDKIEF
ncbi:MAG: hypothetical protein O2971_15595 [Proteobacteria bacterium]|nr:hypothetical protein [Pseudomonadota bacterium]